MKKILILVLSFFLFNSLSFGINEKDTINEKLLYGNIGSNYGIKDRLGYQLGLTFGFKNNFILGRFHKNDELLLFQTPPLNAITGIQNLSILYGYAINYGIFRAIPSMGLAIGNETFRTNKVDTIKGTGWFGWDKPVYQYENNSFIRAQFNVCLMLQFKYFGVGVEPYCTILKRSDYGINITVLYVGKLDSFSKRAEIVKVKN